VLTPRSRKALAIVQMDHTLMDIMVVDEVLRQSMGRPWITVAFDIATRVVLGFALRLEPPSATSVGLALAMACLPKDQWLKDWARCRGPNGGAQSCMESVLEKQTQGPETKASLSNQVDGITTSIRAWMNYWRPKTSK
jgi:transposase InsO family protein